MIGLEPERVRMGIGLSNSVQSNIGIAAALGRAEISKILSAF
jgi:hypothetical protein